MTETATRMRIGIIVFPDVTALDFVAPYEVLARMPDADTLLVWKSRDPVCSDAGLVFAPTTTFANCPDLDVLCIPGGPGLTDLLADEEVVDFVRRQGAQADWVTSICVGSLLLGAAGLLKGRRAACHWASCDLLAAFGAIPDPARVVVDGNRVTGGGVTAGLDFALTLAAKLRGQDFAESIALALEYDPQPPFRAGRPDLARPDMVAQTRARLEPMMVRRRAAVHRAAEKLGLD
jgi:cyclohexyl-isocyanide hydratase